MHVDAVVACFLTDVCEDHTSSERAVARTLIAWRLSLSVVTLDQLSAWMAIVRAQRRGIESLKSFLFGLG